MTRAVEHDLKDYKRRLIANPDFQCFYIMNNNVSASTQNILTTLGCRGSFSSAGMGFFSINREDLEVAISLLEVMVDD